MSYGEMVINGGFEFLGAGGADVFAWWVETITGDGGIEDETVHVHSGAHACKLLRGTGTGPGGAVTQNIEVVPGAWYRLTMWCSGDGTYQGKYRVYDVTNGANIIAETNTGITALAYGEVTVDFQVPANCYTIWWRGIAAATVGAVTYFDDISLYMPYEHLPIISRFGAEYATAVVLPLADAQMPHGSGRAASSQVVLPGGRSHDWGRSDIAPQILSQTIQVRGEWIAASDAAMQQKGFELNALLGVRTKLWRDFGNGILHWRWARCVAVEGDISPRDNLYYADYLLQFETDSGPWHGADRTRTWTLLSGTNPATIICRNDGNAAVTDIKMTITAGTGDLTTAVEVSHRVIRDAVGVGGFTSWQVNGMIPSGQSLVIDSGNSTVRLGPTEVDAYAAFQLGLANHLVQDWLYFEPGRNSLAVSWVGGGTGSTVKMEYSDGWY